MAYVPQNSPQPIGKVTVATPGTAVPLTTALQLLSAGSGYVVGSQSDKVLCNKVSLQSLPANVGTVYFGYNGMNRSTFAGVIGYIVKNGSFQMTTNVNLNEYDANQYYIDADNGGDGVMGALDTI